MDKQKQGFTPIIILIVVLVALVAGAYYLGGKKSSLNLTPTSTPNATANWKTYTNTKYNYTFKYPSEYHLYTTISAIPGEQASTDLATTCEIHVALTDKQPAPFAVAPSVFEVNTCSVYEPLDLLQKELTDQFHNQLNVRQTEFFGLKALSWTSADGEASIKMVEKNKVMYGFSTLVNSPNQSVYNQILSTFQFTK